MCADGIRATVVLVNVLPESAVGEASTAAGATTTVVSVARASASTIRSASRTSTRTDSNPVSDA